MTRKSTEKNFFIRLRDFAAQSLKFMFASTFTVDPSNVCIVRVHPVTTYKYKCITYESKYTFLYCIVYIYIYTTYISGLYKVRRNRTQLEASIMYEYIRVLQLESIANF